MAVAAKRKRTKSRRSKPPTAGWWGNGPPPAERYPGVTLELDARWVATRKRWESRDGRYWFDQEAAEIALDFFPAYLEHHKGEFAGLPFQLLEYQDLLLTRPLFGWKRTSDNLRRFRKVFLALPKGNGKSPLGAGIGLLLTFADDEDGAEVYAAAADREQAAVVFDTARYMVEASPALRSRASVMRRLIEYPERHSIYRVLSADVRGKHGPNIHGLIFDEFHAQPSRDLYEALYRGTTKRLQPVILMITTAGDDDESICAEEWEYARHVIDGAYPDDSYLPVIFEATPDDDWTDPEVWQRVNPGLGVTVKRDAIEAECRAAQNEPRKRNDFLRYHLNRWTQQATAWIPIEWWDACDEPVLLDETLAERPVYGGLDLAQKIDLAAHALVFQSPADPLELEVLTAEDEDAEDLVKKTLSLDYSIDIIPSFWIPEETMFEHERQDRVPYSLWAERGFVEGTEGVTINYDAIFSTIERKLPRRFPLLKGADLGYDPAFATDIATKLRAAGFKAIEVPQNYQHMNEACQVFEALTRAGRVRHGGHPVLRQNLLNVAVRTDDAGRIRPVKPRKRSKRIDGVVAVLMAISRMIRDPGVRASVYETREPVVV